MMMHVPIIDRSIPNYYPYFMYYVNVHVLYIESEHAVYVLHNDIHIVHTVCIQCLHAVCTIE